MLTTLRGRRPTSDLSGPADAGRSAIMGEDGCARAIVHGELREAMTEADVEIILQRSLEKYPHAKPRIISDNGPQFIARDFKEFIRIAGLTHVRASPYYPQSKSSQRKHWVSCGGRGWFRALAGKSVDRKCPLDLSGREPTPLPPAEAISRRPFRPQAGFVMSLSVKAKLTSERATLRRSSWRGARLFSYFPAGLCQLWQSVPRVFFSNGEHPMKPPPAHGRFENDQGWDCHN